MSEQYATYKQAKALVQNGSRIQLVFFANALGDRVNRYEIAGQRLVNANAYKLLRLFDLDAEVVKR